MVKRIIDWLNSDPKKSFNYDRNNRWAFVIVDEQMNYVRTKWNMCVKGDIAGKKYGANGLFVGSDLEYEKFIKFGPDFNQVINNMN